MSGPFSHVSFALSLFLLQLWQRGQIKFTPSQRKVRSHISPVQSAGVRLGLERTNEEAVFAVPGIGDPLYGEGCVRRWTQQASYPRYARC